MDVLAGDTHAVVFCAVVFQISQTLDDLYDQDKEPVSPSQVMELAWNALVRLPENLFYQRYAARLQPLLTAALLDWETANEFEGAGHPHGLTLAFVLRSQLTAVVIEAARILGGDTYARSHASAIRQYFHAESLEQYLSPPVTDEE